MLFITKIRESMFVLWFAFLDIRRHKLRTFLTFLGFVVPVFMISLLITVLLSVKNMFVAEFSRIFGPDELMVVAPPTKNIQLSDETVQRIENIDGVEAVAPRIRIATKIDVTITLPDSNKATKTIYDALVVGEPFDSYLPGRRGIKYVTGNQLTRQEVALNLKLLQERLKSTQESITLNEDDILSGKTKVAVTLHVDELALSLIVPPSVPEQSSMGTDTLRNPIKPIEVSKTYQVGGIFASGFLTTDVPMVVLDLDEAKELLVSLARQKWCEGKNKPYNCELSDEEFFNKYIGYPLLRVRVDDVSKIDEVARRITDMFTVDSAKNSGSTQNGTTSKGINRNFGNGVAVIQAQDALNFFNTFLGVLTLVIIVLGAIISVGSLLGLVNTILIAVLEKVKDIGIMRAFGAKLWQVMGIFIIEGVVITLTAGLIASLGVMGIVEVFIRFILPNIPQLQGFQVIADYLHVDKGFVMLTVLVTSIVGILASLYPAFRAARVDVIRVLRGE